VPPAARGARAHRVAAGPALRTRGGAETAGRHIEEAVRLYPYAGRMHAERAAFHLFAGDFERAATDAQHAIEKAPQDPAGYIALGGCAELTGKFTSADDLYRRACERMPAAAIARIHGRTALVDLTGRLLKVAAAQLLEAGRPEQALELANEAVLSGVRGSEAHPEAEVQVIRRRALERLNQRTEAAEAAMQAGRLCIWNGDIDCAVEELGRAVELDTNEQAGWLMADALLTKSFPLGAPAPDQELVGRARSTWEGWAEQVGPPRGPSSWAYVTRAIVSDLESQRPGADRRAGLFEALLYVEKALALNYTDAQRWGYVAQFLRYLGLEQLAFEAVEAGYRLASADRQVLAERLPLLANSRRFDDAQEAAERLVAMYGEDPWVSAVQAWLALHERRDWERALKRLELPIREGNDHAWYHEMQALAYLGLGRVDEARECYRKLLKAPPVDGNTKRRLALASLALGDPSSARRWLVDAREDPTTPRASYVMTAALEALANDDLDGAASSVDEAIRLASSAVEADDLVFELMLTMTALPRDERWISGCSRALSEVAEKAAADQKAQLELNPPTADSELDKALAQLGEQPLGVARTALLALAARRDAAAGRPERALERYELLRGSRFEPEATIALERVAGRRAAGAASTD
jgi:tetratricopeptide (TPR) repeat protein